ncbi:MAG: glycosyltransferase family 4 protein [Candidatus Hodarchaeota archaeon]
MLLSNAFDPDPRVHQEATALVNSGYDVTILCWDRDLKRPAFEVIDGISVERIYVKSTHGRGTSQLLFLFLFWLKAYARSFKRRFQIIHCHDFDTLPLGFLISKYKNAKLVYDAHESYVDMLVNVPSWLKKTIYRFENWFLRRIHLLITVGEILRETLEKRGAKNTCVVGNWKDPARFEFPKTTLKEEKKRLGISDDQLVISFIARLTEERQLPRLIEAIKDTSRVFLLIGGDGPYMETAKDAARRYSNVCFLGFVNPRDVPLYTAISDAIFYGFDPGNRNSNFSAPNKLFEALAAGKAIITGNFGEIGRIVKETDSGLILKDYSAEEITNTLSQLDPMVLQMYGKNARNAALACYSWDKASHILLKQYEVLVQKASPC